MKIAIVCSYDAGSKVLTKKMEGNLTHYKGTNDYTTLTLLYSKAKLGPKRTTVVYLYVYNLEQSNIP